MAGFYVDARSPARRRAQASAHDLRAIFYCPRQAAVRPREWEQGSCGQASPLEFHLARPVDKNASGLCPPYVVETRQLVKRVALDFHNYWSLLVLNGHDRPRDDFLRHLRTKNLHHLIGDMRTRPIILSAGAEIDRVYQVHYIHHSDPEFLEETAG
jgi:hypothetical protein